MSKHLTAALLVLALTLTGCAPNPSSRVIATPTSTVRAAVTVQAARPTATAPPTPRPPPRIGETDEISTQGGTIDVEVTVHGVRDQVRSTNQFNVPKGRYVVLDYEIKNDASEIWDVSEYDFVLQTADGYVYHEANHAGLPDPELSSAHLGQGQRVRGFVAYDVPVDAVLQSAIYQPAGVKQFVVADLAAGQ